MNEHYRTVAGLNTCLIQPAAAAEAMIVFLHGYGMRAADLTPFAHSLALPGVAYAFPEAPTAARGGYSWWSSVEGELAGDVRREPRDLADAHPAGRAHARGQIRDLLAALSAETAGRPVLLAGFSQGGMLACETILFEQVHVAALAMLSASRIAFDEWRTRAERLRGLRSFVSHGRADADLAFAAGQRLEQFLSASGAPTTWAPFDGGHEIPFQVWRQFRTFARETRHSALTHEKKLHYGTY